MFFKEEHQLQTPSSFVTVPPPLLPFSPPSRRLHFFIRAANVFPPNSSLSRVMSRRCTAAGADSRLPGCRLPLLRWRCGATFSTLQLSGKPSACDKHCDTIVATMTKSRLFCEIDKQTPATQLVVSPQRYQGAYLQTPDTALVGKLLSWPVATTSRCLLSCVPVLTRRMPAVLDQPEGPASFATAAGHRLINKSSKI